MYQIDLFRFIDPLKLCVLLPPRQTPQSRVALPMLHEAGILSEFFLIEEQSVWTLLDIMSEPDGFKSFSYINFNQGLLEVVIDLEQERGR
jgi:hypothetical protein